MKFSSHVWDQLKNKTCDELIAALKKDGWDLRKTGGAKQTWKAPDGRRIVIHYHPGRTYGPKLLKALLIDIGWTENDLKRLKLIK